MKILIVSQCSKNAVKESCRILDHFAERCGDRTWQTEITMEGLKTLRRLLKKNARRNTSVACHWIRGRNHSELLWVVGDVSQFNEDGSVPTNTTQRDVLRANSENGWHTSEDIALLAGLAGLFHDFGKANKLFQQKLRPTSKGLKYEPYRHEWVSLRMFQAFVSECSDQEWLEKLSEINEKDEEAFFRKLLKDGIDKSINPFKTMQSQNLASMVAWLILSHHRLPKFHKGKNLNPPRFSGIDNWLVKNVDPTWNSPQCIDEEWEVKVKQAVWEFPKGSPFRSKIWRKKARELARLALKRPSLMKNWFEDTFSMHLARMSLMLSDHYYSASEANPAWQDDRYKVYANTDRKTKKLKQKLDEHSVGVARNAVFIAKSLPVFKQSLPSITRHKGFKKRSKDPAFRWQDKAYDLAYGIKDRANKQGFFGVNMASTGCGKTFANARIMYGLANEKLGCRFSVALGLRSLTLQTGDALRDRLKMEDEDLAILIGSESVRQLHEHNKGQKNESIEESDEEIAGSESLEGFFNENQYVRYEGTLNDGRLSRWLKDSPKLNKLVSAPILVSTIDHLINATESGRGGKQIAPMLRLLSSDLVLDELDDFDLADMPALTRLVNWAGLLGSRILISSATLPPVLVQALFEAYASGRRNFQEACGDPGRPLEVCCAWFDENRIEQSDHATPETFTVEHERFVDKRVNMLLKSEALRKAKLLPSKLESPDKELAIESIADAVHEAMQDLHSEHAQTHSKTGKQISFGLIRMANINPLVAVAQKLFAKKTYSNHRIHYCIYHSQHPLAVRSFMERQLDSMLSRHDPETIWDQPYVKQALIQFPEEKHLFVVLATPVAEVGRDHDYDWAIAEPSSMRSLIQLAGRIQRHRKQVPKTPNLLILSRNYRALIGSDIAFEKPGFESGQFRLNSHDLNTLLEKEQYQIISSIPRIKVNSLLQPNENIAALEHEHLKARLFGYDNPEVKDYAARWWNHFAHWSYELQRRSPFRQSAPDLEYVLYMDDEEEEPQFHAVDERGGLKICEQRFIGIELQIAQGVSFFGENNMAEITCELADSMGLPVDQASRMFGTLRLRRHEDLWIYHKYLGVHSSL